MQQRYDGEERRATHWHLEKNISVGHIITTIAAIGSVFIWGMKMDSRVMLLESELVHTKESDKRLDDQWRESLGKVESALIRIETKLDQKADK